MGPSGSGAAEGGTVLVVEDDALSQAFARSVLEDAGYHVVVAGNGGAGLAAFQQERPDCVLLDMRMPGLDGPATCRQLRALPGGRDVPVVFMTAQGSIDAFDKAFECGGDDFVTKPVSPPELLGRVQTALGLRRARNVVHEYALVKAQRDRLMRQQLQKERLSALLVHDLKAPLNAISLLSQAMLRGRSLQASDREAVAEIRAQVARLSNMVMNLLDISKARDGHLVAHRERVELAALCASVVSGLEPKASTRSVRMQVALFVDEVDADPHLLRRVLENLLDNALRYAPSSTSVILNAAPREGYVELRVADEGPGIPAALREKVFEAFAQGEAEAVDGRGLGLAFCRLAVAAHQGRIWVEEGSPGAVICVALPRVSSTRSGFYPAGGTE